MKLYVLASSLATATLICWLLFFLVLLVVGGPDGVAEQGGVGGVMGNAQGGTTTGWDCDDPTIRSCNNTGRGPCSLYHYRCRSCSAHTGVSKGTEIRSRPKGTEIRSRPIVPPTGLVLVGKTPP